MSPLISFLITLEAALFFATPANVQVLPLRGQVVDAVTGQPLPYASVGVLHRPVGTVADG